MWSLDTTDVEEDVPTGTPTPDVRAETRREGVSPFVGTAVVVGVLVLAGVGYLMWMGCRRARRGRPVKGVEPMEEVGRGQEAVVDGGSGMAVVGAGVGEAVVGEEEAVQPVEVGAAEVAVEMAGCDVHGKEATGGSVAEGGVSSVV